MQYVQTHFEYKGQVYYSGAVFRIWYTDQIGLKLYTDATFVYYHTKWNKIALQMKNVIHDLPVNFFDDKEFEVIKTIDPAWMQSVNNQAHKQKQSKTFVDELNIDGLLIAWVWYVFIMVVAIIFKDCIGIWLLASAIFFSYRSRKLKGE